MIHLDDQKRKELRQLRKKSRDKKVYVKLSTILMLYSVAFEMRK
jgi:hypothetical protein